MTGTERLLRIVSEPKRRIIGALAVMGTATAEDVAAAVGRRYSSTYYQLREMVSAGVVVRTAITDGPGSPRFAYSLAPEVLA